MSLFCLVIAGMAGEFLWVQAAQTRLTVVACEADRAARRGLRALSHAERRLQALAAQLPTSVWTHPAPTQHPPTQPGNQPAENPAMPAHLFQTSFQAASQAGHNQLVMGPIWHAPTFHAHAPQAGAAGLSPTASPPAHPSGTCQSHDQGWPQMAQTSQQQQQQQHMIAANHGSRPLCSPAGLQQLQQQQVSSTGPSLSGWLGPAGTVRPAAATQQSQTAAGSLQDRGPMADLQQGSISQAQRQRQEVDQNLAEQTQAVEIVLHGVQV